jgi:A/G-specific adenine glycosylase
MRLKGKGRLIVNREVLKEKYGIEMWSEERIEEFRQTLLSWYDKEKRDLPWRRTSDPYKIWVSEIMLQQTRVDTVIPYYENFLSEFPTVKDLANAPEDKLLKVWEGLGYYSRVRNMQAAAIQVMTQYGGVFPTDPKEIQKLKGIGPYTAGAISSIAFGHPEPAVDGNLMRVLSRLFEIDVDIAKASSRKVFEAVMRHIIDPNRPGDFNQALMDLGATICTPTNYDPSVSPIKEFNASYLNETWLEYPVKSKKKKAKPVTYLALLIQNDKGEFLLEKRPQKGLLANMWTFPLVDDHVIEEDLGWKSFGQKAIEQLETEERQRLEAHAEKDYHVLTELKQDTVGTVTHIFSHLKWTVYMYEGKVMKKTGHIPDHCEWVHPDNFDQYVFPVPQSKMWKEYQSLSLF